MTPQERLVDALKMADAELERLGLDGTHWVRVQNAAALKAHRREQLAARTGGR